jgi:hypothetical protein
MRRAFLMSLRKTSVHSDWRHANLRYLHELDRIPGEGLPSTFREIYRPSTVSGEKHHRRGGHGRCPVAWQGPHAIWNTLYAGLLLGDTVEAEKIKEVYGYFDTAAVLELLASH